MGKLLASHRYDRLPLLPSGPGGFSRSWSYKTYPLQMYQKHKPVTSLLFLIFYNCSIGRIDIFVIQQLIQNQWNQMHLNHPNLP